MNKVKLELFMIFEPYVKGSIGGKVFNWNLAIVEFETYT